MKGRLFIALGLALFLAACAGREGSELEMPGDASVTCASGSTGRFQEVQQQAPFPVYCPTYLPQGFRMDSIAFERDAKFAPDVTPPRGVGTVTAVFVNPDSGTRLRFIQGLIGASFEFHLGEPYEGQPTEEVTYGEFPATLYPPYDNPQLGPQPAIVFGHSPDERQHFIEGTGLDGATLKRIAEGMVRLGPFGAPPGDETSEFVPPEAKAGPLRLRLSFKDGLVLLRWDDLRDEAGYTVEGSVKYGPPCELIKQGSQASEEFEFNRQLAADAVEFAIPKPAAERLSVTLELVLEITATDIEGAPLVADSMAFTGDPICP